MFLVPATSYAVCTVTLHGRLHFVRGLTMGRKTPTSKHRSISVDRVCPTWNLPHASSWTEEIVIQYDSRNFTSRILLSKSKQEQRQYFEGLTNDSDKSVESFNRYVLSKMTSDDMRALDGRSPWHDFEKILWVRCHFRKYSWVKTGICSSPWWTIATRMLLDHAYEWRKLAQICLIEEERPFLLKNLSKKNLSWTAGLKKPAWLL